MLHGRWTEALTPCHLLQRGEGYKIYLLVDACQKHRCEGVWLATQARQEAQESLAKAREEADAAVQAAELQALKAQDEAQSAQAAAQSAASNAEHWKSRCVSWA